MKQKFLFILSAVICILSAGTMASAQDNEQKKVLTPTERASIEADRLADLLHLEVWQVFYVDSTLQHDYSALQAEIEEMQKSRVDNVDLYVSIQDKWMERIDSSYKLIFDPLQWETYLKNGAAKNQKAREKRKLKVEKAKMKN